MAIVVGAVKVLPDAGAVSVTVGGTLAGALPPASYASTSMRRLALSTARSLSTRMRVVVTAEKTTRRHTSVLPRTVPPGTACQVVPVQYCRVKSTNPYLVKVIVAVGSTGPVKLSCTANTATSSIVRGPAKLTSNQSGKLLLLSFHPPPLPQFTPRRSPLIALLAG